MVYRTIRQLSPLAALGLLMPTWAVLAASPRPPNTGPTSDGRVGPDGPEIPVLMIGGGVRETAPPRARSAGSNPAGRVVRIYTFEEREFNASPIPADWFRAQDLPPERPRPGFPPYNAAEFDFDVVRPESHSTASVKLPTKGGSTSLRLASRALPIFADADYLITAAIRTSALRHARASICARLLDAHGRPIPNTEIRSRSVVSPDRWELVWLEVTGGTAGAAYLQLDLELLQPEQLATASGQELPLGRHQVWPQDFQGAAWFDDVAIFQLPRVELWAGGASGVVRAPEQARFTASVRDLTGESLQARLTLTDLDGAVVHRSERPLSPGGETFEWSPSLPRFGWYRGVLEVLAEGAVVGTSVATITWLPEPAPSGSTPASIASPETTPFAIFAETLPLKASLSLPPLLAQVGVRAVHLTLDLDQVDRFNELAREPGSRTRELPLRQLLDALLAGGVDVGLTLPRVPLPLANELQVDPSDPLVLGDSPPTPTPAWAAWIQPMLDLYGQRIRRWQFGSIPEGLAWATPETDRRLRHIRTVLAASIPEPRLTLGWRADLNWPWTDRVQPRAFDALTLSVPFAYGIEGVAEAARRWQSALDLPNARDMDLTFQVEYPPPDLFGQRAAVIALIQRTALLWHTLGSGRALSPQTPRGGARLAINTPWDLEDRLRPRLLPHATLGAWALLRERLSGRVPVGKLTTQPGIRALLFASRDAGDQSERGPGLMIAWSSTATGASAVLTGHFAPPGGHLRLFDAFGNSSSLAPADPSGLFRIPLTDEPVYIEGVDTALARFTTGLALDAEFIPAVAAVHERALIVTNTFDVRINGEILLTGPLDAAGRRLWTISPTAAMSFSIAPGQSASLPFSFSFPALQEAGPASIPAVVTLSTTRRYPPMRVNIPVTIGLADLDLQTSASLGPTMSGPDAVIVATVTNNGSTPRTLQIDLVAPGLARQQQAISNLPAGESASRQFVLKDIAGSGARVRITLSDVDGPERLTRILPIP